MATRTIRRVDGVRHRPRGTGGAVLYTLVSSALVLGGCDAGSERQVDRPRTTSDQVVVDDRSDSLRTQPGRTRVISMIPAVTEFLLEMNAIDRIVARTRYDDDPRLADLPSVGGGLDPDLEAVLSLSPDLVVLWPDNDLRGVGARLRDLDVPTYAARIEGLADFRRHARAIGTLIGDPTASDSIIDALDRDLSDVRRSVEGLERPSVLYVIGLNPPTVAGPGTFVDSLLTAAGGRNAFPDLTAHWPQVSLEEIVRRSPDYVAVSVASDGPVQALVDAPGWSAVPAVQRGDVAAFDPNAFNRPGPGIARAAAALADWLHPERSAREPPPR